MFKIIFNFKKWIFVICLIFFTFASVVIYFNHKNCHKRLKYIIDIPVTAFDENGRLISVEWKNFLKNYKPIGVIFFAEHLENKNIAKQMIADVRNVIGERQLFIAADEEGGRVNRMDWIDIMPAADIAQKYLQLKAEKGTEVAKKFVEDEYSKMFKEMKDIGLNLDFAPNLDINIYEDIKNGSEYQYYKQAVKYVNMARKKRNRLLDAEKTAYIETMMFYAYLDDIGVKSLDNFSIDGKIGEDNSDFIEQIRFQWKELNQYNRDIYIDMFKNVAKYANYASVIGDRSFGNDPYLIGEIADIFVKIAKKYGIKCTIKHLLGHGRALGDTHNGTEFVDSSVDIILRDLYPYKVLIKNVNFAMPADIVYQAIDADNSAMNSSKVFDFFRKNIGNAVFIGDDIMMRDNVIIKQKCDIHIKIHNKSVEDIIQFISDNDYVGYGTWKRWFD